MRTCFDPPSTEPRLDQALTNIRAEEGDEHVGRMRNLVGDRGQRKRCRWNECPNASAPSPVGSELRMMQKKRCKTLERCREQRKNVEWSLSIASPLPRRAEPWIAEEWCSKPPPLFVQCHVFPTTTLQCSVLIERSCSRVHRLNHGR